MLVCERNLHQAGSLHDLHDDSADLHPQDPVHHLHMVGRMHHPTHSLHDLQDGVTVLHEADSLHNLHDDSADLHPQSAVHCLPTGVRDSYGDPHEVHSSPGSGDDDSLRAASCVPHRSDLL